MQHYRNPDITFLFKLIPKEQASCDKPVYMHDTEGSVARFPCSNIKEMPSLLHALIGGSKLKNYNSYCGHLGGRRIGDRMLGLGLHAGASIIQVKTEKHSDNS